MKKINTNELKKGNWIFERDGYGFEIINVKDLGKTWEFELKSTGFLGYAKKEIKKNHLVYGLVK